MRAFAVMICLCATPALASCPDPVDTTEPLADLFNAARAAKTAQAAQGLSDQMWALWATAPDAIAQEMLDAGMSRRSSYDYLGALEHFDRLVAYCPDYAEGYNQRAFVNFLRQDVAAALTDLDRAIELSPTHVAALSGRALTLMGLGRIDDARADLTRALALNPWIPERALAAPGGILAPEDGEDI